jgi:hypothetical protein
VVNDQPIGDWSLRLLVVPAVHGLRSYVGISARSDVPLPNPARSRVPTVLDFVIGSKFLVMVPVDKPNRMTTDNTAILHRGFRNRGWLPASALTKAAGIGQFDAQPLCRGGLSGSPVVSRARSAADAAMRNFGAAVKTTVFFALCHDLTPSASRGLVPCRGRMQAVARRFAARILPQFARFRAEICPC